MDFEIDFSYDSHVHFFGTGIPAVEWDMKKYQNAIPTHLNGKNFLRGFGWNDDLFFAEEVSKNKNIRFFLSKIDGHTAFISNNLIQDLNIDPQDLTPFKDIGYIVSENQKDFIERLLPKRSHEDLIKMALHAQNLFLSKNINRVRHLTCTKEHWEVLTHLEQNNLLELKIECFFSEFMEQNFEEAIEAFAEAEESDFLKPRGLKVFYDGSFGSKTAYSFLFPEISPRITYEQLKNRIEVAFELDSDIAVHTIGEKAVEEVVSAFTELFTNASSTKTKLHLEHCPAISETVISKLRDIPCTLHFQPSHYKGDKYFLDQIKKENYLIYPFDILKKSNINFNFGSDSPVTVPDIPFTQSCVEEIIKSRS